jgi:iron complex transport system ATP-binding protein
MMIEGFMGKLQATDCLLYGDYTAIIITNSFTMLEVANLSAGYDKSTLALHDVTLGVGAGEIAAVIGPNGCGKSTLLRCIAGLFAPRQGSVFFEGENVADLTHRARAKRIAILPQQSEISSELTVEELVALGRTPHLAAYGTLGARDLEIIDQALRLTSTSDLRTRPVLQVSGGERQRVLLARALAQQPNVLLLDEPTSNLDLKFQYEILKLVHRLARHEKLCVVVVLHQINLAASLADTMLLLNGNGTVCAQGAPSEVMTRSHLESVYGVPLQIAVDTKCGRPQAAAEWSFAD